jgi:hypothetical protein
VPLIPTRTSDRSSFAMHPIIGNSQSGAQVHEDRAQPRQL